ncbi:unnamed protein product, partial [Mesorhabditis belari]|uniref:Apple domain-containing protein n=1 Tax=Mesorhabditis belari TaxID=2138241 RepID=A0AAF3J4G8_9BILA
MVLRWIQVLRLPHPNSVLLFVLPTFFLFLIVPITEGALRNCYNLPKIKLVGGTLDELNATYSECLHKCGETNCCLGFAYSQSELRCYLKSAFDSSEEEDGWTSGLMGNRDHGQRVILKNVLIEGSRRYVELPSVEECHQYCTAFGMYTWTPARGDEVAQCQCIQRIRSIRYVYGAQSSIFPSESSFSH